MLLVLQIWTRLSALQRKTTLRSLWSDGPNFLDSCLNKNSPPTCANCKGENSLLDLLCPEFKIQKNVQLLAAERNISLKEAREVLSGKTLTPPLRDDIYNFPLLSHNFSREPPNQNFQEAFSLPSKQSPLFPRFSSQIFGVSYASAASTPKIHFLNKSLSNEEPRKHKPSSFCPPFNIHTPGHKYFSEPNGRSRLNPSNGCASQLIHPMCPTLLLFLLILMKIS